jgi:hypothetical protein
MVSESASLISVVGLATPRMVVRTHVPVEVGRIMRRGTVQLAEWAAFPSDPDATILTGGSSSVGGSIGLQNRRSQVRVLAAPLPRSGGDAPPRSVLSARYERVGWAAAKSPTVRFFCCLSQPKGRTRRIRAPAPSSGRASRTGSRPPGAPDPQPQGLTHISRAARARSTPRGTAR